MKFDLTYNEDKMSNSKIIVSCCTIWMTFWIFMIPLLVGCGENAEADKTTITIPINFSSMMANSVSPLRVPNMMEIKVIKVDYDEVIAESSFGISPDDFQERRMIVTLEDILVEEDLLVEVFIFDEDSRLFFEGRETIYIESGDTGEVVIYMEPAR